MEWINNIILNLRCIEFIWLFVLCISSIGIGYSLFKLIINKNKLYVSLSEEFLFSQALGFGLLSLITLGIGLINGLYPWVFWILFAVLIIISYKNIIYFLKIFHKLTILLPPAFISIPLLVIFLLLIILVFVPTIIYDAMVYHLAVPAKYIQHHRIYYIPYICFSNYSFNMEMLFTIGLLLSGDQLAKLIHFLFGILSSVSIASLANKYFNRETGIYTLLTFFSLPLNCFIMVQPFNDFGLVFYEVMAVYAFINWITTKKYPWLFLCYIMCGLSIGIKYTGVLCIIILLFNMLWYNRGFKTYIINIASGIFIPIIINLPWFIKAFIYTGDPVYPLCYNIFGGLGWNEFNHIRYISEMTAGYGPQVVWYLKPFACIYQLSFDWDTAQLPVGPIFILLLVLYIVMKHKTPIVKFLCVFCISFFIIWVYTSPVDRFLLPCIALMCVISGCGITYFLNTRLRLVIIILIVLHSLWNAEKLWSTIWGNSYWRYIQYTAKEELLQRYSPIYDYYSVIRYINLHLPLDSKILFIGEARSYYCEREVFVNSHLDTTIIVELIQKSKDINELLENLNQMEISYILYNQYGANWLSKKFNYFHWTDRSQQEIYQTLMKKHVIPVYQKNNVILFKISYSNN